MAISLCSVWVDDEWVGLPIPSSYVGSASTIVNSGRNIKGELNTDVIKSDVAKVELKWNFLTVEQFSEMAQIFEPKYHDNDFGVFFRAVSFFDVIKGGYDGSVEYEPTGSSGNNPCRVFYCGDRKVTFANLVLNDDLTPKGYQNVSLSLIDTGRMFGE